MGALAKNFEALGFRIIEGGKSGKLVVLNTVAIAEIYNQRHGDHILRALNKYREKLDSNLSPVFAEHCRPSEYRGERQGRRKEQCFELTKIGFLAFVSYRLDPNLSFLLALAFDALERDNKSDKDRLITQINARIRQLQSKKSGQDELDLTSNENVTYLQSPPEITPVDQPGLQIIDVEFDGENYQAALNPEPPKDVTLYQPTTVDPQVAKENVDSANLLMLCRQVGIPMDKIHSDVLRNTDGSPSTVIGALLDNLVERDWDE